MKHTIILLTFLTLVLSCSNDKSTSRIQNDSIPVTPEAFENKIDLSYLSTSSYKRSGNNIIDKLFEEALEKSESLNQFNERFKNLSKSKYDSLSEFLNYEQVNNNYWASANSYINQIEDSILKVSTLQTFSKLETEYNKTIVIYESKRMEINQKSISLNDQLIILKLTITEPMMAIYQRNEKPDIKSLKAIIKQYDGLIIEAKKLNTEALSH